MAAIISCPYCQRRLRLADEYVGKEVQCPKCMVPFVAKAEATWKLSTVDLLPALEGDLGPTGDDSEAPSVSESAIQSPAPASERRRSRRGFLAEESISTLQKTPRRNAWAKFVIVGILLGGGLTAYLLLRRDKEPVWEARVQIDAQERRQEVEGAFQNMAPVDAGKIGEELKPLFEKLGAALRAQDQANMVSCFDVERMCDELFRMGLVSRPRERERAGFVQGVRMGFGATLARRAPILQWTDFEIRNIKESKEAREAVVIIRHRHDEGTFLRMRWWVAQRVGAWQIYDMEDLDIGLRMSTAMAIAAQGGLTKAQEWSKAMGSIGEALTSLIQNQDVDRAEKLLRQSQGVQLPKLFEGMRLFVTGTCQLHRGQAQLALESFDKAHQCQPDMPALDLMKAIAFNHLQQWESALKHVETYQKLLGDDANVCREMGLALQGLTRFPEAVKQFRKSLDYHPKDVESFWGLLRCLAVGEKKDELGSRFAKLDRPKEHFPQFAEDCRQARDGQALEAISQAMRKLDPNYAAASHYLALAKAWLLKAEDAPALYLFAQTKEKDAALKDDYTRQFFEAMAQAGKPLLAYAVATDGRTAFSLLAAETKKTYRPQELRRLVAAHAKKYADDPWLPWYEAEVCIHQGDHAQADKLFARGLAKPPKDADLTSFRSSRVLAKYHTGQALAALADIQPAPETYRQLAWLAHADEDFDLLRRLTEVHAKTHAKDSEVIRFQIRLKIHQNKAKEAIAMLKEALAGFGAAGASKDTLLSDTLRDIVDAGMALDAYRALPDPRQTFQILAADLSGQFRDTELLQLLDLHRQMHLNEPLLDYYAGILAIDAKKWDQAVVHFRKSWNEMAPESREMARSQLVFAMYKAGQAHQAYLETGKTKESFNQLANLLVMDRKGTELAALVEAHRGQADADVQVNLFDARAKVFLKSYAEALPLIRKLYQQEKQDFQRRLIVQDYVLDRHAMEGGIEGYRTAPDPEAAFSALARHFVHNKNDKALDVLLAEHRKGRDENATVLLMQGELHRLRGQLDQADPFLAKAHAKAQPTEQGLTRQALYEVRVKLGKVADTYKEFQADSYIFADLAQECLQSKNAGQLKELLAVHRVKDPDDEQVKPWEADALWLANDFEGTLRFLAEHQKTLFKHQWKWKADNYRVRCLLKLLKLKEAIQEAERLAKPKTGNRVLLVLAHASTGNVDATLAIIERFKAQRHLVGDCYRDADLGPILRGDAFKRFRERYPEPAQQQDFPLADD